MIMIRLIVTLFLIFHTQLVFAEKHPNTPLVEASWVAKHLDKVLILDVRTNEKSFYSQAVFDKDNKTRLIKVGGHIPGARLIKYKYVRGERLIDGKSIKHMVASAKEFEALMQTAGVNQNSHIVITSNAESTFDLNMAARLFWQVKYFGHDQVSLLNGGTAQWLLDGHKTHNPEEKYAVGNWQANQENLSIFASSNDTKSAIENSDIQIVDVRSLGQYLGSYKSGKAKTKGHIPSAKIFPIDLFSSRSTPVKFLSNSELEKLANAFAIDEKKPLITYCNSGHMASGSWFVFHELFNNKNAKLYDGSMHQWTHEDRPVVSMIIE